MQTMLDWLQFVLAPQMLNGLSIGVAVILMALGLTIIFGLLDVINMAHGEFYAMGAYVGLTLAAAGVSFWLLLILVPIVMAALGYVIERTLIQRVFHHKDRHILTLLLTFGMAIVLEDIFKMIYGPQSSKPDSPITGVSEVMGMLLPNYRLFLIVFGALVIAAVWVIVYKTSLGAMVRAAAFDKNMSSSLGVPVSRVYAGTFAFGVALAGLSGVLLAPLYSVFPTMGKDFILMAFSVVIVGGLGSISGAVVAGLALTQIQTVASLYISPAWTDPLVFGIMVVVLMLRPQGMFGRLGHG
ncbi:MAG: transporter permease [Herminiimonas sp.]|nr:transporter permease [Herminiimonas sp.]MDB5853079.1 transporter permease [Herminiimonas sp.]